MRGIMPRIPKTDVAPSPTPEVEHTPMPAPDGGFSGWDELLIEPDTTDGRHIYRASNLGNCDAALVAHALGRSFEPMPQSLRGALDEGTAMEPVILKMHADEFGYRAATYPELCELKDEGVIAGYNPAMQQVQVRFDVGSSARVQAHLDRLATHQRPERTKTKTPPTFYVVEAKAFGPDYWNTWKSSGMDAFPRYAWQLTAQMAATGLVGIFVVGRKSGKGADVSISEIDVTVFEEPPISLGKLKARILKLEKMVKDEDVPPCKDGAWPCAFFKEAFCLGKPEVELEDLDDETLGQLCALYHAYSVDMSQTDEQKQAKKDRDEVRAKIDKHLAEAGIERGKKFAVKSAVGERYEFEWVERVVKPSAGRTDYYPSVKLLDA